MRGYFGVISKTDCTEDFIYGTAYHSHPVTKRASMVIPDDLVDAIGLPKKICTHCQDRTGYF